MYKRQLIGRIFQKKSYDALSFERDFRSYFPLWVTLKDQDREQSIPLTKLKVGDRIVVRNLELIPADAVRRGFAEDAAFARCLASDLAAAYRMVVKELKNQKLRSGLERLANWLVAHQVEHGGATRFELPFEKKVLAARLGMAPEVLSRSFAALVPYKVKVSGATIDIRDPEALRNLAKPIPTIDDPDS